MEVCWLFSTIAKMHIASFDSWPSQCINEAFEIVFRESKSTAKPHFKRKLWWSESTKIAKNRKSLWYSIWSSCEKPREGHVYASICYKLAKSKYRQACRAAFNVKSRNSLNEFALWY